MEREETIKKTECPHFCEKEGEGFKKYKDEPET